MVKEIHDLIIRLLSLAYQVTNTTNTDVFVNYSGHVNCVSVRVYINGWDIVRDPEISCYVHLHDEDSIDTIKDISKKMEDLLC